jgi:hypothetical protein
MKTMEKVLKSVCWRFSGSGERFGGGSRRLRERKKNIETERCGSYFSYVQHVRTK